MPYSRAIYAGGPTAAVRCLLTMGTVLREYCDADPSLGFELFKRMGEVMIKRLQSARIRLVKANVRFSSVGGEHQIRGGDA